MLKRRRARLGKITKKTVSEEIKAGKEFKSSDFSLQNADISKSTEELRLRRNRR